MVLVVLFVVGKLNEDQNKKYQKNNQNNNQNNN